MTEELGPLAELIFGVFFVVLGAGLLRRRDDFRRFLDRTWTGHWPERWRRAYYFDFMAVPWIFIAVGTAMTVRSLFRFA